MNENYKLAKKFREEENLQKYEYYIEQAAAEKYPDAMKEYATLLMAAADYKKALEIYKELADKGDVESMERVVDMCEREQGVPRNDKATLNFILDAINKSHNEIYLSRNFDTVEEYLRAIERRRIASRIKENLSFIYV